MLSPIPTRDYEDCPVQRDVHNVGEKAKGEDKWEVLGLFASLCMQIWKAQNEWVFNHSWWDVPRISGRAVEDFNEFCDSNGEAERVVIDTNTAQTWKPPPEGILKINIDGDFDAITRKGGIGVVIRDDQGRIWGMRAVPVDRTYSTKLVEALGFREAADFGRSLRLGGNYILEGVEVTPNLSLRCYKGGPK